MKKYFFSLFFFCAVFFCHAGTYTAGDNVENLTVMHDFNGGAYVVYVQDGKLKALHENGDDTLTECVLSESVKSIQNITSLVMHPDAGIPFGIITTDDSQHYILTLDIDFEEKSGCFHANPFSLPLNATEPFFEELINGDIRIWYICNSKLHCRTMNGSSCSISSDRSIREEPGNVSMYGIKRFETTTKGYYIAQKKSSEYTVSFFSESDGLYTFYDVQKTFSEKPDVREICTGKDTFYYCVTDGSHALVCSIDSGSLSYVTQKNAVTKVFSFYVVKNNDTQSCFFNYLDDAAIRHAYYETNGVCRFESVVTEDPVLFFLPDDRTELMYGSDKKWNIASFITSETYTNSVLPVPAGTDLLCCTFTGEVCFVFWDRERKNVMRVTIAENGAVRSSTVSVPETVQKQIKSISAGDGRYIFTGTDEIIMDYPGYGVVVVHLQDTSVAAAECTLSSYSGNCNGRFFTAYYINKKITVQNIGERNE